MLVAAEDQVALKRWVIPKLSKISDADPDIMADYALAILTADSSDEEVKKHARDELTEFLSEATTPFIEEALKAMHDRSYLKPPVPTASVAPSSLAAPAAAVTKLSAEAPAFNPAGLSAIQPSIEPHEHFSDNLHSSRLLDVSSGGGLQSRKRTFNDRGGSEPSASGDIPRNGNAVRERPRKQLARRGGSNSRGGFAGYDRHNNSFGGSTGRSSTMPGLGEVNMAPPSMPMPFPTIPGMPPMDLNDPMALMTMMAMTMGMTGLPNMPPPPFGTPGASTRPASIKEKCTDYETLGVCTKGHMCPYEHGDGDSRPIIAPSANGSSVPEHDPANASLAMRGHLGTNGSRRSKATRASSKNGGFSSGRSRAPFSLAGPSHDPSMTTIVVEQIPQENFSEEAVREFFSQFGDIVDVKLHNHRRIAVIKYDDHEAASRAYNSPKVIFDNRFVKVYWHKPDSSTTPAASYGVITDGSPAVDLDDEEMLDMAEIEERQTEAQKAFEERLKKQQEVEAQDKDVKYRLKLNLDERKKLAREIMDKTGKAMPLADDGTMVDDPAGLDDLLAGLQDQSSQDFGSEGPSAFYPSRGGRRGRGGYSSRGTFAPRARGYNAYRGSFRGRAAYAGARGGVKRWDNRPRKIAITGIAPGNDRDESLREYLLSTFDIESIEPHATQSDTQIITFKERYNAEQVEQPDAVIIMNKSTYTLQFADGIFSVPNIGAVSLAWVPNTSGATVDGVVNDRDTEEPGAEDDSEQDEHVNRVADQPNDQDVNEEHDYDVADDTDRWMGA